MCSTRAALEVDWSELRGESGFMQFHEVAINLFYYIPFLMRGRAANKMENEWECRRMLGKFETNMEEIVLKLRHIKK